MAAYLSSGIRLPIFHARELRILPTSSKPPLEDMSGESKSTRITVENLHPLLGCDFNIIADSGCGCVFLDIDKIELKLILMILVLIMENK